MQITFMNMCGLFDFLLFSNIYESFIKHSVGLK